jgi:hypothetical protein
VLHELAPGARVRLLGDTRNIPATQRHLVTFTARATALGTDFAPGNNQDVRTRTFEALGECPDYLGDSGAGSAGCFIATAAYGTSLHPQVAALRRLRDRVLLRTSRGSALVRLYYQWSPPFAALIARHEGRRAAVRGFLTPLVFMAAHPGRALFVMTCLLLIAIGRAALRQRTGRMRGGALKLVTWLLAAVLLLPAGAMASEVRGFYAGASVGASEWENDCGGRICSREDIALRVMAGYRLNRVVAFEAYYADLGGADALDFSLDGRLRGRAFGASTTLGWRAPGFEIGAKLGFAIVRAAFRASPTSYYPSETVHNTEASAGLVGAVDLSERLALRLDIDLVTVALVSDGIYYARGADVFSYTLGLAYRF